MDNPKCRYCSEITLIEASNSWDLEEYMFCSKCLRRFKCEIVIKDEVGKFQKDFSYIS